MFNIWYEIKYMWDNFWYDYIDLPEIRYGSNQRPSKIFRKQRLFNIIIVIVIVSLFFLLS